MTEGSAVQRGGKTGTKETIEEEHISLGEELNCE